jgi:hypothetical protein
MSWCQRHRVPAVGPLEVELRAVEPKIRAEQVRDQVDHRGVPRERPQVRVLVHRLAEPPDVGLLGRMIGREVELVVGGGEGARLLDLGRDHRAQLVEPPRAHVAGQEEVAVPDVALARRLVEHERRARQDLGGDHCASAPPSMRISLPVM